MNSLWKRRACYLVERLTFEPRETEVARNPALEDIKRRIVIGSYRGNRVELEVEGEYY